MNPITGSRRLLSERARYNFIAEIEDFNWKSTETVLPETVGTLKNSKIRISKWYEIRGQVKSTGNHKAYRCSKGEVIVRTADGGMYPPPAAGQS